MTEPLSYVAVVDDDDGFSRALGRLLRASGFEPVVYSSAKAFLQDASQPALDCVVLDIQMAGLTGLELRERLLALGRTTPVVFVTALEEPETRQKAEQIGCAAYLRKPVPRQALIDAIAKSICVREPDVNRHVPTCRPSPA
jgi:FixJ family two-component response regulator